MNGIPLVRAGAAHAYLEALAAAGAPVDALLEQARLPARAELRPDGLIAYQQLLDFVAGARRTTGLRHLPLLAAQYAEPGKVGGWGRILAAARSLGDLIARVVTTFPMHTSGAHWWSVDHGEEIALCQRLDRRLDLESGDVIVPILAHMVNAVRHVVGPSWQPAAVTAAAPFSLSLESLGIEAPVRITGVNSITIPRSLLGTPTPRILALMGRSERDPLEAFAGSSPQVDFEGSLRQALTPLMAQQEVGIELLAEITRLKVRTLQRKLTEAGIGFRSMLQEVRFARAVERMQDPAAKLIDIAFEVGFSDPAHFTRAFRRWTGLSPRQFRRTLGRGVETALARRTAAMH